MKTIRSMFATLAVAVCFFFFAPVMDAQSEGNAGTPPVSNLPAKLPIGDQETMLNWIVSKTNGLPNKSIWLQLRFTKRDGGSAYNAHLTDGGGGFDSYQQFMDFAIAKATELCEKVKVNTNYFPESKVAFSTSVLHFVDTNTIDGLISFSGYESMSNLTETFIRNSRIVSEFIAVPVPNLQKVRIDVGEYPDQSWYTWDEGVSEYSANWPDAHQENNYDSVLRLTSWYCFATNRVRISVTAGNETAVYTQFGERIAPPIVEMTSDRVRVQVARGADVTIETSTDLLNWSVVNREDQQTDSEFGISTLSFGGQDMPRQFYRAFCQ